MKALILVGGFGTRLRPLTFSVPKSVVELANKPIVAHQIEALAKVGVKEVILAISYQPELIMKYIPEFEKKYNIKITCSQEEEPMGTAGPIRLAKDIIIKDNAEGIFFVLNSDVICDFPLEKLLKFHKAHGKEGTIMLTRVDEPSRYGVVVYDEPTGRIKQFVEKPKEFISNKINAGLYLFNTSMIDRIELKPTSIERVIFPKMAAEEQLYCLSLEYFWMDIGQPKDFIVGSSLYLEYLQKTNPDILAKGPNIKGNVLIDPSAKVASTALIGPDVTIGPNCVVEEGVRIQNSCVFEKVQLKSYSWISGSLIGWSSKVGKWARIEPCTVLGENVTIKDELFINGAQICPHKEIASSVLANGTILL